MKKIVKVFLVMFSLVILTGCGKNYDKLSYTEYSEYFNSKHEYVVLDKSKDYDITTTRYLEAGDGNVQVFYIEYAKAKGCNMTGPEDPDILRLNVLAGRE